MQFDGFREWLERRGITEKSVNTRSAAVRKIEKELAALGSSFADLDEAFEADGFASIRTTLDALRIDARNGGRRYAILFPETGDPLNRLASSRAYLGQYGQFCGQLSSQTELRSPEETYWFVGASFGRTEDQTERFVREGIWAIRTPTHQEREAVLSMKLGERIAIKAAFVQRHNLPFDNRGATVSVMRVKARGTITENPGSGDSVAVTWDTQFEPNDWYFYTYRPTIWAVHPGNELADKLIAFAFDDDPQDIAWFCNHGSWSAVFGDSADNPSQRFWIEKTIVVGRPDREGGEHALGRALWSPQTSKDGKNIYANMLQVHPGDVVFHLTDNEAVSSVSVAAEAADDNFFGVEGSDWAGQPGYRIALRGHETLSPSLPRSAFLETEPFASELRELAASGAKGLFYNRSRGLNQGAYLTEATPTLLSILNRAYEAYAGKSLPHTLNLPSSQVAAEVKPYTLSDALENLFIEEADAEAIQTLWTAKKNIILQGPPGVGKSYAAQKLAFALIGAEDRARLGFVQFHQSYSYEDFVEGFRPDADGFVLQPGKFVEFCRRAEADPQRRYVFIIDEINRGNLSKIFGELMLLIESDKRDQQWAMPLSSGKAPFYVPANVFLMGLMNTADRSLAVVDYALRRRFAFVDLAPNLSAPKFRQQLEDSGVSSERVALLIRRVGDLNDEIIGDLANLGPGFAIGHSFFCAGPLSDESDTLWYERVMRTEIVPLLREYWFDQPQKASHWERQLLAPL